MANRSVGLKNIAFALGISINTVSRALRDCDDISEATKEKVREKAFELGYMPNGVSQFIKRDGKKLVAVVVNSMKNMYFAICCQKLFILLNEKGYDYTIVYTAQKNLTLDVLKQCISQRVDGILTFLEPNDDLIANAKLNNIPVVMIGREIHSEYVSDVYTDDELGGQLVANYLMNYHAISKFVYVKMANVECSKRRQRAFERTIKASMPEAEVLIVDSRQVNSSFFKLIASGYLGIFCFNDELAYRVLDILNEQVPNVRKVYPHMHIIGYDSLSTRMSGLVDLTSIDFDYDAICEKAIELLEERLEKPKESESVKFSVKLHVRKLT